MIKNLKNVLSVLLVMIVILSVAACGKNDPNPSEKSDRSALNVSVSMVVNNLSPFDISSLVQNQLHRQMYESFYFLNELTGEYEPRLATSHEISEDGKTYTFHLRTGVKFHNGDVMTADDVVFSIEQARKSASLKPYTSPIADVNKVDGSTVALVLNAPYAPFLHHSTNLYVVSKKMVEKIGDAFGTTAESAGTGPYMLKSYKPDTLIEFEAFDDYYRGKASIQNVNVKPIVDQSTGLVAFQKGELDFYAIPLANWKEVSESGKFTTVTLPSNHITYLALNPHAEAFKDINVRKAIQYCINRDAINLVAYEGLATPAYHMLNPDYVFGAPAEDEGVTYTYDLEKAKEYLKLSGHPDGLDIGTLTTLAGTYFHKAAQVIQADLARVGIKLEIGAMEEAAFIAAIQKGTYESGVTGYACQFDYDFFSTFTHTRNEAALIKFKGTDIDYKAIDDLFDKAAQEMVPQKRKAEYLELDSKIMETATLAPLFHKALAFAWNKDLNVKVFSNYYYLFDWSWK